MGVGNMRKLKKDKYIGGGAKRQGFKIFNAFTLAEMMVVMLIVSIVLAAMAPVMTTKNKVDNSSPWRYSPANSSDAYFGAGEAMRAFIGQVNGEDADLGKLIVNNNATDNSHILFKSNNDILGDLYFNGTSLILGERRSRSTEAIGNENINIGHENWPTTDITGSSNITIGDASMRSLTTGSHNIGLGTTLSAVSTGSNNIGIGDDSIEHTNGDYNIAVGTHAYRQGTGGSNVIIGGDAMSQYSGNNNVVMGTQAMFYGSGSNNVAIGTNANYNGTNSEATYTGTTAIGHNAQASAEDAVAIGKNANSSREQAISINGTASGYSSIAMGTDSSTDGSYGVAIGYKANATGGSSVAIGKEASSEDRAISINGTAADSAIAIKGTAEGVNSIAIGDSANAANFAIAIGSGAKANGSNNIAIGWHACRFVNGSNKTCIGEFSGPSSIAAVGQGSEKTIFLGDADTTVYIPGNLVVGKRAFIGASLGDSGTKRNCLFYNTERGWHGVFGYRGSGDRDSWYINMDDLINGRIWNDVRLGFTLKNYISDRRLKYVGTNNNDSLDKIKQLKVFNYTFKKDPTKEPHVGVIAQDLQKVFPNAVKKGADGFLTIRMEDMFYAVINAIKELDAKYQAQEKRINDLEKRIEKLEARK